MLSPVLLTAALTLGAWGPGGCGPVGSPVVSVAVQAEPAYEWRPPAAKPDLPRIIRPNAQPIR
jgi:hypothetical protein